MEYNRINLLNRLTFTTVLISLIACSLNKKRSKIFQSTPNNCLAIGSDRFTHINLSSFVSLRSGTHCIIWLKTNNLASVNFLAVFGEGKFQLSIKHGAQTPQKPGHNLGVKLEGKKERREEKEDKDIRTDVEGRE